ncbi:MAG: cytochrome c biogenesis protein, partial [Planctomycetaceae bacterium]
ENMATTEIAEIDTANTSFEAWYNNAAPASYGCVWYIIAFVLACASLIGWTRPLSRASFVIALVTFVFHTFALYARIEISGRPPVTNLYGSAVFIGWGAVLLGLIFEVIYKSGIGNLVSTMTGGLTLFIAYYLGADGDTFEVLQAVLDTQFWLATHVVCITLGYSATFLAGMFGLVYILKGVFTKSLRDTDRKDLSRMIYGTICFAMLFSFVGTILGGLWADDSWGRFWGWDPKENGAMMIVVWNAILMHARWDNMIKDRGVAVLSVAGNIVTAWSWFGVNELKAGLHTYGFTEGRLFWLTMFVLSQLLVICIGLFPKDMWRSQGKPPEAAAA